jgi:hypothetical protein
MNGPNRLECYITFGWKGLPITNTLACCEYGPWFRVATKLFTTPQTPVDNRDLWVHTSSASNRQALPPLLCETSPLKGLSITGRWGVYSLQMSVMYATLMGGGALWCSAQIWSYLTQIQWSQIWQHDTQHNWRRDSGVFVNRSEIFHRSNYVLLNLNISFT